MAHTRARARTQARTRRHAHAGTHTHTHTQPLRVLSARYTQRIRVVSHKLNYQDIHTNKVQTAHARQPLRKSATIHNN